MSLLTRIKSAGGYVAARVLPIPIPEIIEGEGSTRKLGEIARQQKITSVLLVTDEIIRKLGILDPALTSLQEAGIEVAIFDKVLPDPSIDLCNEGFELYTSKKCNGIICVGGGSVMDCAKVIGARATNPSRKAEDFMGTLTVLRRLPPLIAVPTTAGTGSETTIAAVVMLPKEKKKLSMVDPCLCPHIAVLDPKLLEKLPPAVTAATGMDALTHAIESYVSPWRSTLTAKHSLLAIKNIFKYLRICYSNPSDMNARGAMLHASFDAGVAFTRASVGYVHAIAHQFGAIYHTPHGIANAIVLPHILDFYRDTQEQSFAEMALAAELGDKSMDTKVLADKFVDEVKKLGADLNIPKSIRGFDPKDASVITQRALNEAHGNNYSFTSSPMKYLLDTGYPACKYLDFEQCQHIVLQCADPESSRANARL